MLLEISVLIFTLAFVIFAIFSVLYLIQLRKTAKFIEDILHSLNKSLPEILSKVESIAENISETSRLIRNQASSISNSIDKIKFLVDDIVLFEQKLKREIETPFFETISTCNALMKGFRAFLNALFSSSSLNK